ncbi:MAG TPA: chromate efflux transporter [Candidatus Acidoferrum sp.]|nr:chromate efflux transporter [Candidatus Acidoferrum sp.]
MKRFHRSAISRLHSLLEIFRVFLRLGFVAFGGPAAHIAMMENEFVRRRQWLTREEFLDRMGAVGLLPGPSSTELAIYLGELRGGFLGLIASGIAFLLPAALLVAALAWTYVRYGSLPQVAGILWGVKPIVVVLVAQAIWALHRAVFKSKELAVLAAVVFVLSFFRVSPIALLIGGGVAWVVARRAEHFRSSVLTAASALRTAGTAAAVGAVGLGSVFVYFLKVGAVLFGSGYVLLALLQADLVTRLHWLTQAQLLDAVAVSQATPGPFFTVATFIGYLLAGWKGAVLATFGTFLPAFLFVAATAKVLPKLRRSSWASAFLDGVNASAIALMAFVGFQFARAVFLSATSAMIAGLAALLLFRFRVNSAWLIGFGALLGIILSLLRLHL